MSETNFLPLYLRKTDGVGEKVNLSPQLPIKKLYAFVSQTFKLTKHSFELFFKGSKLVQNCEITLTKTKISPGSIIHIQQKGKTQELSFQVKVFCQGSLYNYKASKESSINELKQQFARKLKCNNGCITISYLGKVLKDNGSFVSNFIANNDLLSLTLITPLTQESQMKLKPKEAESVTFTPSEQDPLSQQLPRQLMRKSSMKSSQESRDALVGESKRLLQVQRPKSQAQANTEQNLKKSQQNFNTLKFSWLMNQKVIQTESINVDDPELESEDGEWTQCKIQLINQEQTKFYIIQCNQSHTLQAVLKVLDRYERKSQKISVIFPDENVQKMAEMGKPVLQIARVNNTRIIHHVIFN